MNSVSDYSPEELQSLRQDIDELIESVSSVETSPIFIDFGSQECLDAFMAAMEASIEKEKVEKGKSSWMQKSLRINLQE